ncbi:LacI family DNA-binding transcriptional regulator [Anaeromicrobium sediminis]|nr:LacI family DNA-binding transcriptional regulator [Anaeromicrobium sediminis]
MITIKDVAKKAGVSIATVSRVMNGNYPVSDKTKKKVMDAIRELGYRPNAIARSLKVNRTYMIGMVVPDISNPYYMEIAKGVERVVSKLGYNLIFCSSNENTEREMDLLNALNEKRVEYILLIPTINDSYRINGLLKKGMKIVLIDRHLPFVETDSIVIDNFEASYKLIEYAIKRGHKKIGIINGLMRVSTARERYEAFRKALEDYDIPFNPKYSVCGDFIMEKSYKEVKNMIIKNRKNLPTMIFATNNKMAEGAIIAIKEMNLNIPRDISLGSFGELSVPQLIHPQITTITHDAFEMGRLVGEVVSEKIDNRVSEYKNIVMNSAIKFKGSIRSLKNLL